MAQEKLDRSVFIGNIKIDSTKKDIKGLLQPFGEVEKVWFRSIPVEQSKIGPKAAFILKKVPFLSHSFKRTHSQ